MFPLFGTALAALAIVAFSTFDALLLIRALFDAFLLLYPNLFPALNTFYSVYFFYFMYLPYLICFQYSILPISVILYFRYILPYNPILIVCFSCLILLLCSCSVRFSFLNAKKNYKKKGGE